MSIPKKEQKEKEMFGVTIEELEEAKPDFVTDTHYSVSILSDAQHIFETMDTNSGEGKEVARKLINRAKYFLSKHERQNGKV